MNRRRLLAGVSLMGAGLAGCLSSDGGETGDSGSDDTVISDDDANDDEGNDTTTGNDESSGGDETDERLDADTEVEYERCVNRTVWISDLPEPARTEAETAIEDGAYETDDDLVLADVVDVQESFLKRPADGDRIYYDDRDYYGITVVEENVTRLHLDETIPTAGMMSAVDTVSVTNELDAVVTADVRLEYRETRDNDETTVLVEESLELEPTESAEFDDDVDYRFGVYSAAVTIEGNGVELSEEMEWKVDEVHSNATIAITKRRTTDDIIILPRTDVAGLADCEWNDDGNLVAGNPLGRIRNATEP